MSNAPKAVFLSYARDDAAAARRIAEALRASGLEVWFDENELRGGDTWDAKIRKQINDCSLFIAIISQHTEERSKGYFRLEWKLAVEQTHMLLDGVPFLVPVVIDATSESSSAVPPEFMRVQWTRLPGALPTPQFVEQVKKLLEGKGAPVSAAVGA
ncbi:MAG: toll/interleukin-1 receptor domain-containing protein, partial [Lacunisphaera sp.]|nr:toll/interleukin-1 receptor domain-containing protein [Lacunisphaera sp.]